MYFIRNSGLKRSYTPCVATIGAYDGLHLGHQHILKKLQNQAQQLGIASAVISFEPLPKEYFMGDKAPQRLTLLRDKARLLHAYGVERFVCIRFDQSLQCMEAETFIDRILNYSLNIRHLVVGDDFRFGKDRRGDFGMLEERGRQSGFSVEKTESIIRDGVRISSSVIREAIVAGEMTQANDWLGYTYQISGRVRVGQQLGHKLGYPTLNLALSRNVAVSGVYVVQVRYGSHLRNGVASVGTRPAVGGGLKNLEVYVFDCNENLYGVHVTVFFLAFLRAEADFSSLAGLTEQMHNDAERARQWLAEYHPAEL